MMLDRLYLWFRSIFLRGRLEREMREEMAQHIERTTQRLIARGISPADAAVAARREFGNFDYIQEAARDARGRRWLDAVRGDVRFALRHFRRTPLSTVTMVLVLALGIGVNVALFSVLHSMTTLPAPGIPRDDALVRIRGIALTPASNRLSRRPIAYPEVAAYGEQHQLFRGVAASAATRGVLSVIGAEDPPVTGGITYVSDNYFSLLRVRPALGNVPGATPLNAAAARALVGVINHVAWQDIFGGVPDVVGRTLRVEGVAVTVVGVMPEVFRGTDDSPSRHRVWLPLAAYPFVAKSSMLAFSSPDSALFNVIARLQPGVSRSEATATVKSLAARALAARAQRPDRSIGSADVASLLAFNANPHFDHEIRLVLAGAGTLTLLLLLVTCTNVSSLLVGVALARQREIAVRLSLGAGRWRVVAQLLTESAIIALVAGALALAVMWAFLHYIDARIPDQMIGEHFVLDWRATVFTCGIALVTAVLFGLSPALHATRLSLAEVMKDAGAAVSGSRSWLQRTLVVAQIALTQPLLVALGVTALVAQSEFARIRPAPYDDHLVELYFAMYGGAASVETQLDELARIRDRLAALPGVLGAAPELRLMNGRLVVHDADRAASSSQPDTVFVRARAAVPGYLALHDVPIIRGRDFTAADVDSLPTAAIIGHRFARQLFGSADPIGKRVVLPDDATATRGGLRVLSATTKTIVGVVDEESLLPLRAARDEAPLIFVAPQRQFLVTNWMLVRTVAPGDELIPDLRAAARSEVPQLDLRLAATRATRHADNRREWLQIGAALMAGGALTLLLSAIGLYAVVAFAVAQRTREIGIRTALGAQRIQVTRMFFLSGIRLSILGLVIGLPLSLLALEMLPEFRAGLPRTLRLAAMVGTGVLCVASLATWLPARRAARIDPLVALRSE